MDVQTFECSAPRITIAIYFIFLSCPLMFAVLCLTTYQIPLYLLIIIDGGIGIILYNNYRRLLGHYPLQLIHQARYKQWQFVYKSDKSNMTITSYYFISHSLLLVNAVSTTPLSKHNLAEDYSADYKQHLCLIITKPSLISNNLSQLRQLVISD